MSLATTRLHRDWTTLALTAALAAFGALFQVRMSGATPEAGQFIPLMCGGAAGLLLFLAAGRGRADRAMSSEWLPWAAAGAAALVLAALLLFGQRYRGGLYLPGLINPSEPVKICWVVFSAAWWARRGSVVANGAASAAVFGLVALAGDFGMLAQLAITASAMVWLASWSWGIAAAGASAAAVWAVGAMEFSGHLAKRMEVWRDPFQDITGAGWQTLQAMAAIVAGGATGRGWGAGSAELVPIASSDFVYAALAEDLGYFGCAAVIALWLLLVMRMMFRAARLWDTSRAESLLAAGIASSLAVQLLMNIAGVLNAIPMTGITLPLISHGGSSAAVTLAMCGLACGLCGGNEVHGQ